MNEREAAGIVLYDDSCGFCREWVPLWKGALARRGFRIAPLQEPWVAETLGMTPEEVAEDIRLYLPKTRELVSGANAYRYVMRRIWWAYPAYLLTRVPGLGRLFDLAYRKFADNRHAFSGACGLHGRGAPHRHEGPRAG